MYYSTNTIVGCSGQNTREMVHAVNCIKQHSFSFRHHQSHHHHQQACKPRSYAISKLRPTGWLTGVKCRATRWWSHHWATPPTSACIKNAARSQAPLSTSQSELRLEQWSSSSSAGREEGDNDNQRQVDLMCQGAGWEERVLRRACLRQHRSPVDPRFDLKIERGIDLNGWRTNCLIKLRADQI